MLIAKCLATLEPCKETYCSSCQWEAWNLLFPTILHVHSNCFERKVVVWPKTVHWCEQNSWFLFYHKFKITNSFSRIKNEMVTSFLRIFTNSFTRTSFLFAKLRIYSYEFVRVFSMLCCEWPVLYESIDVSKLHIFCISFLWNVGLKSHNSWFILYFVHGFLWSMLALLLF